MSGTEDTLKTFILNELLGHRKSSELAAQDNLLGSGMIDSLGIMRLVAFIDEKLGVKVPYEDITVQNFKNLETLGRYVDQLKKG